MLILHASPYLMACAKTLTCGKAERLIMPTAYAEVKFRFGTSSEYSEISSKDANSVYFLTDTNQIFVGDEEYATSQTWIDDSPVQLLSNANEGAVYISEDESVAYAYVGGRWVSGSVDNSDSDDIDLSGTACTLSFKGTVDGFDFLPSENNSAGDVYYCVKECAEFAFSGSEWQKLGSLVETFAGVADDDYVEDSIAWVLEDCLG